MPWMSPLFRTAGAAILSAARNEFAGTTSGQLVRMAQRELRSPLVTPDRMGKVLDRYARHGAREALRELRGTQFGQFAREIHRYAKGDVTRAMLDKFLRDLGPAGTLIKALVSTSGNSEVSQLVGILQSFGFEVLPPAQQRRPGDAIGDRGRQAAQEYLEALGAKVVWPDQGPERTGGRLPFGIPRHDEHGQERGQVPLPMADGPTRKFSVEHPIVTGEMVHVTRSSNVYSFGYDIESNYLYIRFLGYVKGVRGPDGRATRGGPGSLYRYKDVTPEEFMALYAANSKGDWIWDNLRVRGTWSGHQKDYELVGVMQDYVPRKATVRRDPRTGELQEYFVQRRVKTIGGGWLMSALPNEVAGDLPWGEIDRGRPDRGAPDRGLPDRF